MDSVHRSVRRIEVARIDGSVVVAAGDGVAVEEPLEIRLHGSPFVVIMRTPGADRELVAGFLLAERVIDGTDDLGLIEQCRDVDGAAGANTVNVTLTGAAATRVADVLSGRRAVAGHASCGVCGRRSIDDLLRVSAPVGGSLKVARRTIVALPERLRSVQRVFDETGGLHAAGLFDPSGRLAAVAEDVGRHNAVDKVIGSRLLRDEVPLSERVLFVSGRASFEIVQKAVVAGIPVLGAVSAPSSLAVDLADEAGVTLVGFVRGEQFNVYTHPERIETS